MANIDTTILSPLIGLIHESVTKPDGWTAVCNNLQESLNYETVSISLIDRKAGVIGIFGTAMDHKDIADYANHFRSVDPFVDVIANVGRTSTIWRREDRFTDDEWSRHQLWNGLLKRRDLFYNAGIVIPTSPDLLLNLNIFHTTKQGRIEDDDVRDLVQLLPHLRDAECIRRQLGPIIDAHAALASVVDAMAFGLALVDEAGEIVTMNAAARAAVEAKDGLRHQSKRLVADHSPANDRLNGLITQAVASASGAEKTPADVVAVRRSSQRRPYMLQVLPLPVNAMPIAGLRRICCAVLINDPDAAAPSLSDRLRAAYGLTAAEARVAEAIAAGYTIASCAERFGVTIDAIRKHLANIFIKTDTNRQSDLIGLLHRSFPALRGRGH